jgi:biotin transport system substrate-specific component
VFRKEPQLRFQLKLRDYPRIAIFVGLIAALGLVPALYIIPEVPVTAQTLGVMLAGAVLGSYRGALAVLLFEILALVGLPILASGKGGLAVFTGPTAGYLVGWIFGAYVIGLVIEKLPKLNLALSAIIGFVLGGIVTIYIPGILWVSYSLGLPLIPVAQGNLVFLIGDSVKIVLAVLVLLGIKSANPKLLEN